MDYAIVSFVVVLLVVCIGLFVSFQNRFREELARKAANAAMHLAPDNSILIWGRQVDITGARSCTLVSWTVNPGNVHPTRLCAIVETVAQMDQLLKLLADEFNPEDSELPRRFAHVDSEGRIKFESPAGDTGAQKPVYFRQHPLDLPAASSTSRR